MRILVGVIDTATVASWQSQVVLGVARHMQGVIDTATVASWQRQ